ncbi:MAG: alpha-L-rhamnosidase N-terminal domain-containing protein, partial [Clostridia bacterium]|nr:alpha-L-rhamnosidase N-terminal domain-containing protein [Clostridia bacterium]
MRLYSLKTNERLSPLGIDGTPFFSWKIQSDQKNVLQAAYRIEIPGLWDSGRIESREQAFVSYQGPALAHGREYRWRVTVWDQAGGSAAAEASFEVAKPAWQGQWAESSLPHKPAQPFDDAQETEENPGSPAVLFERAFALPDKQIQSARVYASAYGVYRLRVNEKRPDDREFAPEYTSYEKLQYFQTYDVKALLHAGKNTLDFYVGDGWY